MSQNAYYTLTAILAGCSCVALLFLLLNLGLALVGWRSSHRKRRLVRSAIFFGALVVLGVVQYSVLFGIYLPSLGRDAERQRQQQVDAASVVLVGDTAPPFTLLDTKGSEFALANQRGKVVLLNFFATWCGPCQMELPHLEKFWEDNANNPDFAMIVIGREETTESVVGFQSKYGYSFPMAADSQQSVYSLYAKQFIPRTYLISPKGIICFASTGFHEEDLTKLQQELAKQLQSIR